MMKILSTIFLLFLTVSVLSAEEKDTADNLREYDVEIIIFEDAHARYINSETWQQDAPVETEAIPGAGINEKPTESRDKRNADEINATSYKALKPGMLGNDYKRMNGSSEYNVLFYSAWRQAGLDAANAFEINTSELVNAHTSRSENTINGNLKLVLARYLHFYADLDYQRHDEKDDVETRTAVTMANSSIPAEATGESLISNQSYPMQIHRRMRSKELHYIDHPLVGILIQINPVKKTEEL